mgnify:CR=1 FL=1
MLYLILVTMILTGTGIGGYYWYQNTNYIKTEDARIAGDIYRVMPRTSGKIIDLDIKEGDIVSANQIIGQLDTANMSSGTFENTALRSPINGTVIKVLAKEGEVVSPSQPVAMIVDMNQLYISANIEETELNRVRVGQTVDFTVDSFPGHVLTGKVIEITEASASTFSLLPAINTSGNFTKVTQRIPIKISIDDQQGLQLFPGMSVVIKIHIKESKG